ncbi:hypothetical protein ABT269_39975 [Streptomyces viridosporus]|uniref:hypothetical protein n=1 Tax=Streptomyces viridosporus TaxID=67581 RepID=UPI003323B4BB
MDLFTAPVVWLLFAFYLQALPGAVLLAVAVARPHPARCVKALLRGQDPVQLQGRNRRFSHFYGLSALFLAAAAASSALRHEPWIRPALYAALAVLTALGALAWHTTRTAPPATPDGDAEGEDGSDDTAPDARPPA